MAIGLTPIEITDNFQVWLDRTNEIITELSQRVVTASPAGNTTTGNATIIGNVAANNFSANVVSGTVTAFTSRASEIRQVSGNTAPIAVIDQLLLSNANTTPMRLVSATGPKIKIDNTNHYWDFGANSGLANTSFVFQFNGTTVGSISHEGLATLSAGITANGNVNIGSGKFLAANGVVVTPAYSFVGDPNSGIYSVAADTVGISAGGALRAQANTTALTSFVLTRTANGTVSTPGYGFTSDVDSGFFLAAVGQVALATAGAERARFSGANIDLTSTALNFATFGDFNTGTNTGIRIGRSAPFSRVTMFQANTTTPLIQLIADEVGSNTAGQIRVTNALGATYPAYSFGGDTNTGIDNPLGDTIALSLGGLYNFTANTTRLASNVGLAFGSTTAASANNLTRHLDLWGGTYGFNVTSGSLNAVLPTTAYLRFVTSNTADICMEFAMDNGDGKIRVGAANAAFPAYSFIDDTNTGIFNPAADVTAISVGGVERFRIGTSFARFVHPVYALNFIGDAGAQFMAPDDSAAGPGFTWASDPNTGMYRNAADSIAFATAGTARCTINAAGLQMHSDARIIAETGTAALPSVTNISDTNTGLYYAGADLLGISAGGAAAMYVGSSYSRTLAEHRFFPGDQTSPGINWSSKTNTGFALNTYTYAVHNGAWCGRFEPYLDVASGYTFITRGSGDARYVNESSQRYKDQIGIVPEAALKAKLLTAFDAFDLTSWVWGGELTEKNIKRGTQGIGLIAEAVEGYLPEAVKYTYKSDADGEDTTEKQANALDPMPIIAAMIEKIRELEARLNAAGA